MRHCLADLRAGIMVQTGKNMRCTGYEGHTIFDESVGHLERDRQLGGAIVDTRQDMTMQVNHAHRSPSDRWRQGKMQLGTEALPPHVPSYFFRLGEARALSPA